MSQVKKLFLGHSEPIHKPKPALKGQLFTVLRIWRNYNHHDFGIERIIRLVLAAAQFLSPGLYIKQLAGRYGSLTSKLATEVYVILKLLFPLLCLKMGWFVEDWALYIIVFFMSETVLYLASLIFLSDVTQDSIQPHRSLTLLFINFFEIVSDFSLIYAHFNHKMEGFFNTSFQSVSDAVYFSFVTAATVGYGDFYPVDALAKQLAMIQITLTFVFVGLFLNFFSSLILRVTTIDTASTYRKTRHKSKKKK